MNDFGKRLLKITEGCRKDMHEPDEMGVSAFVIGTILDNAMGEEILEEFIEKNHQEIVVIIRNDIGHTENFNLATLIAYARAGAKSGFII